MNFESLLSQKPVVFFGAGVSLDPPAGLPDWNGLRNYTIEAVGSRDPILTTHIAKLTSVELIGETEKRGMTPEIVASVIAGVCPGYFESFRALNEGTPNANHVVLARAAKEGLIQYLLTTNFDLFIDEALRREGTSVHAYRTEEEFEQFEIGTGVHLLKLHGCLSLPLSITVTVDAQQQGLSTAKKRVMDKLLLKSPFLFWGYSGADLKIDLDYLRLITMKDLAPGFVWNLYQNGPFRETPNPYLLRVQDVYEDRGLIVHGLLPGALRNKLANSESLDLQPSAEIEGPSWREAKTGALPESLGRWAQSYVSPQHALQIFGHLHAYNGQHVQALSCFEQLSTRAKNTGDYHLLSQSLLGMGKAYKALGETRIALQTYERMLEVATQLSDAYVRGIALTNIGDIYRSLGQLERAIDAFRTAETIYKGQKHRAAVSLLVDSGEVYNSQGDLENAFGKYSEAEAIIREKGWKDELASILHKIGRIHVRWGNYDQANRYFQEELELLKAFGDRASLGYCYREIGVVHLAQERHEEALSALNSAASIAREQGNKLLEGMSLSDQGTLHMFQKDYAGATGAFQEAIFLLGETGERRTLGGNYLSLATAWLQLGKKRDAEECYIRSIDILGSAGDRFLAAEACRQYAEFLEKVSRGSDAVLWYTKRLSLLLAGGFHQYAKEGLAEIAKCRAKFIGDRQTTLFELLNSAIQRAKLRPELSEKIARMRGWSKTPFDLSQFCAAEQNQHGREFAAYLYAIEVKYQSMEFREQGRFLESLACAMLGFDLVAQIDDLYGQSIFLNDIGFLSKKLKHYDKALEYFNHALRLERIIGGQRELTVRLLNLGDTYAELQRLNEAETVYREASEIARSVHESQPRSEALLRLANVLKLQKKVQAIAVYAEAEPLLRSIDDRAQLIELYMGKGKALFDQGRFDDSIHSRSTAQNLCLEKQDYETASVLAFLIANTYDRHLNRSDEAFTIYNQGIALAERAGRPEWVGRYQAAIAELRRRGS